MNTSWSGQQLCKKKQKLWTRFGGGLHQNVAILIGVEPMGSGFQQNCKSRRLLFRPSHPCKYRLPQETIIIPRIIDSIV